MSNINVDNVFIQFNNNEFIFLEPYPSILKNPRAQRHNTSKNIMQAGGFLRDKKNKEAKQNCRSNY